MERQIGVVSFDVGSTLIYAAPSVEETFSAVAQDRGYDLPVSAVVPHMAGCWELYERLYEADGDFWCSQEGAVWLWNTLYTYLCEKTGLMGDADWLVAQTRDAYLSADHWALYHDVVPCLERLASVGVRMCVLSNWASNLPDLLNQLGLSCYFEKVFASAACGLRKPSSEFFLHAYETMGIDPRYALHVGDHMDADGRGALQAGARAFIVDREGKCEQAHETGSLDLRNLLKDTRCERVTSLSVVADYLEMLG